MDTHFGCHNAAQVDLRHLVGRQSGGDCPEPTWAQERTWARPHTAQHTHPLTWKFHVWGLGEVSPDGREAQTPERWL